MTYNIEDIKNTIICGDSIEELKKLPDNSVDAIVTDPPAGIGFMGKEWDSFKDGKIEPTANSAGGTEDKEGVGNAFSRSRVHIGASSNKSLFAFQDFIYQIFSEAIRVLKPGGYALVWALPRTSHHTAMGIERAGFEIRDKIYFIFGSGFPKSLNIGKKIDEIQGNKREVFKYEHWGRQNCSYQPSGNPFNFDKNKVKLVQYKSKGNSPWEGWGTALKPAVEEWILARKPLSEKTVAENVLKWGTGGLNIDRCRIETRAKKWSKPKGGIFKPSENNDAVLENNELGRFPSHLILDGSEEVEECLPKNVKGWSSQKHNSFNPYGGNALNKSKTQREGFYEGYDDSGSASRFFQHCPITEEDLEIDRIFYGSKASKKERNMGGVKNIHPTAKNLSLMRYLCRLITPPKGIVLDMFAGSGSTLIAAKQEGFNFIGIEKESEYVEIAEGRLKAIPQTLY